MNPSFRESEARRELLRLYAEVDELTRGLSCDKSTDCCRFARTGREPYPTAVELAELRLAIGPKRASRGLPIARGHADAERSCPLLDASGRCSVYASRPFGCRTFFCDRARDEAGEAAALPRGELRRIAGAIAALSERFDPRDPHARPLSRALAR
jgi:Fe-S-cluster containining protein